MNRPLSTACLFFVTIVAIVTFIAPAVFGQQEKAVNVEGGVSKAIPAAVEWRFDKPQPEWKPALPLAGSKMVELERTADALRVTVSEGSRVSASLLAGGIYVDLPDWRREEWSSIEVRARTTSSVNSMLVGLSPSERPAPSGATPAPWFPVFAATSQVLARVTPIVRDGLIRTYRVRPDWGEQQTGPFRRVALQFHAPQPGSIDILSVTVVPATGGQFIETTLEPRQMKTDFDLFRMALEEAHAGLYRWTTKREMDAEFARARARLDQPMTILQFRNVLTRVIAAFKCGHTLFTNYRGDEISTVLNAAKQFPLALQFEQNRAFVVLNQGLDERVKPGMEVLAINGKPLAEILLQILPSIPHDGDIRTNRMYVLGFTRAFHRPQNPGRTGFGEAYRLYIGNPASFKTTLRNPRTKQTIVVNLDGVTNAEAALNADKNPVNRNVLAGIRQLQNLGKELAVRYFDSESLAVLRIPWFSRYDEFLTSSFAELKRKGTKNLIIDLRGNSGGSDASIPLLFSYLARKPFRIFESVHMTTKQPSFIQYTDREFTAATNFPEFDPEFGLIKPDPKGGWLFTEKKSGNRLYKPLENPARISDEGKPPAEKDTLENPFNGAVYVLTDGGSFSAAADFAAIAAFHKRATFIGEETGGVAEGNNSGVEIGVTLPASQLHLQIPTCLYVNPVHKGDLRRRGTIPKYAATQTIDDLAKGRDTVIEFTRELIRSGKKHE